MNLELFFRYHSSWAAVYVAVVSLSLTFTQHRSTDAFSSDDEKAKNAILVDYDLTETDLSKMGPKLQGLTKPRKISELTAKVSGGIKSIYVQEGDVVPQGSPLALIDDQSARAAVKVAEVLAGQVGQIERCKIDLKIEEQRLSRLKSVVNANATSQLELWEKKASRDQKRAILDEAIEAAEVAQAQLLQAQVDLDSHKIVAPFTGQVIQILKKVGTAPQPGEPVMVVADLSELEVEMHLPLSQFGKIRVGDQMHLKAGQPVNRLIPTKVISVSPLINPTSNTFRCLFVIDNRDKSLPAGFAVTLQSE